VSGSPLETAERALELCDGDAQVTVLHERSLVSRFARSRPTQATEIDAETIEVTCTVDGHVASARATGAGEDSVREVATRARQAAEAAARSGPGDYPGLAAAAPVAVADHAHDSATAQLDPRLAGAALERAFATAARRGLEAFGVWTAGEVQTAIASTAGVRASEAVTDAFMKVICRDPPGRSGFASHAAVESAGLDGAALAERAAAKVVDGEPAELPPGEYPAVLDADAVGLLLDYLGYLAFNGLAHVEGRGALSERLGTQVASPRINLADAPLSPGTLPRVFDAEGVPKATLPLIEDGVARNVVHDTRSAAMAGDGARSTGHALEPGGSPMGAMPTNLVLESGQAADVDALAASIERGLYVTRFWYVNVVRDKETLLTGVTRDGTFLIEDGKITRPVRNVRFTDSALRILSATEELTRGSRLVSEFELYGTRFASGSVCPALRADAFRITGLTQ
jgi:predicted Zn-dependent protease